MSRLRTAFASLLLSVGIFTAGVSYADQDFALREAGKNDDDKAVTLPRAVFPVPAGTSQEERQSAEWMINPENRQIMDTALLEITDEQSTYLASLPRYDEALEALSLYYALGVDMASISWEGDTRYYAMGDRIFYEGEDGRRRSVFNPRRLRPAADYTMQDYNISPSGRIMGVTVTMGGTELGEIRFINLSNRRLMPGKIEPVVVAGGAGFIWLDDDHIAYRHAAHTDQATEDPSADSAWYVQDLKSDTRGAEVFGTETENVNMAFGDWPSMWSSYNATDYTLGYLWRGNYSDVYVAPRASLIAGEPEWVQVRADLDIVDAEAIGGHILIVAKDEDGFASLYVQDVTDAENPNAARILGEGGGEIAYELAFATGENAYVLARAGATHRLYKLNAELDMTEIVLPFEGEIDTTSFSPELNGSGELIFDLSSPDHPYDYIRVRADGSTELLHLDRSTQEEERPTMRRSVEFATSADGAQIPITIIEPANREGETRPTILNVYGSYGDVEMTGWWPSRMAWLHLGGVGADCHVRGGGYYGPAWYEAGMGPDKSPAIDDMEACAEHLVTTGRAQAGQVASYGASAGGLISPPVAFKRPDLFGAAVVHVGMVNPLRMLDGLNGASQLDEVGDPRIPGDAAAMALTDSIEIALTAEEAPALHICVGFQDSRVPHWNSGRLAAIMAQRFPETEMVIHADAEAGHSCGYYGDDVRRAKAGQYAWLWQVLGGDVPNENE